MYRLSRLAYRRPAAAGCSSLWSGLTPVLATRVALGAPRHLATHSPLTVPALTASDPDHAAQADHLQAVASHLQTSGILKVTLSFADPDSDYLKQLLLGLHRHQGHQLPISHSASSGWFWDVRPNAVNNDVSSNTATAIDTSHKARSETMENFPWHTDCSYEDPPPRFFALQVLQHDRHGGGTLSIMNVSRLSALLSHETRTALARPEFEIGVPPEFTKDAGRRSIIGSLFAEDTTAGATTMRFRGDILAPLTDSASTALAELTCALSRAEAAGTTHDTTTLHLAAQDMPTGTVLLVDNRRWLHARNHVRDPDRHLRRVRWDAVPF
jgi:hypothetical protein